MSDAESTPLLSITPEAYLRWWEEVRPDIPFGYCWCGCGEPTTIANRTEVKGRVRVKGQPVRFRRGHANTTQGAKYTIEERGRDTPCWIWKLNTDEWGYASGWTDGKMRKMHRYYYEERYGPVPVEKELHHLCHTPPCVNPEHVVPVEPLEHRRMCRSFKLTLQKAREIRRLWQEQSMSRKEIARKYGVTPEAISAVTTGKNWRE